MMICSKYLILLPKKNSPYLLYMQNHNKFRKSDLSIQGFDRLFNHQSSGRLRNSFSNNNVSPLNLHNYRVTISNQQVNLLNSMGLNQQIPKSSGNLKEKLSFIQEKLNNAKKEMSKQVKNEQRKKEKGPIPAKDKSIATNQTAGTVSNVDLMRKSTKQQFISSHPKPNNITTFHTNPYSSFKNNQYYIAEVIRARHQKNSLAVEHIATSINLLKQCQSIKHIINSNAYEPIILPKIHENRKTLFLDLDETLIHCLDNSECEADFRLKITIEGVLVDLDILIRPYALTFLKKICKRWEVVIFTASHQEYADAILNEIDPDGTLFHHRLYRQHCIYLNDLYVKDLSRVNRDSSKVVLVDNAAYSYCLQLANAIPILPYYDGKDFELAALESYLGQLEKVQDIRLMNGQYFKLKEYIGFDNSSSLIEQLYMNSKQHLFK